MLWGRGRLLERVGEREARAEVAGSGAHREQVAQLVEFDLVLTLRLTKEAGGVRALGGVCSGRRGWVMRARLV